MSTKNFIKQNNKKLFELRLLIRTKPGINLKKISLDNKKRKNNNNSSINKTQQSINETFQDKLNNISYFENPSININNNSSLNKNIKNSKIQNQKLSINSSLNKSNIMKDFNVFNKNLLKFNDDKRKILINSIKRFSHNNSHDKNENIKKEGINSKNKNNNYKISQSNKNNNKEIIQFNSILKRVNNIKANNSVYKTKNNNTIIENDIISNIKDKIITKLKLKNNNSVNRKNISTLKNNNKYKYNSFIVDNIKTVNNNKISNTKNNDSIIDYKFTGRNANNNKKIENFQKYLFNKKFEKLTKKTIGDNKFTKNNSLIKKQNNNTIYYENKENKRNFNENKKKKYYLNQLSLKDEIKPKKKDNILIRNNKKVINKKNTHNLFKFETKYGRIGDITIDDSTENRTKKINDYLEPINNNKSFQEKKKRNKKNSNQNKEINMDNIIPNEKNDDKLNDSSLIKNSGILSVNEIEDIICYNDMSDINKEDNYLFYHHEYFKFLKKNKNQIYNLFFGNKNENRSYVQSKIKIRIRLSDSRDNSERKSYK